MSYDVYIGDYSNNYTSNGCDIFYRHIPGRGGLWELSGKSGYEAGELLERFFKNVQSEINRFWESSAVGEPKFCAQYDSPNGWGSTVGLLVFAANLMAACFRHPNEKVKVSG